MVSYSQHIGTSVNYYDLNTHVGFGFFSCRTMNNPKKLLVIVLVPNTKQRNWLCTQYRVKISQRFYRKCYHLFLKNAWKTKNLPGIRICQNFIFFYGSYNFCYIILFLLIFINVIILTYIFTHLLVCLLTSVYCSVNVVFFRKQHLEKCSYFVRGYTLFWSSQKPDWEELKTEPHFLAGVTLEL